MGKPAFCTCENIGANKLYGPYREADHGKLFLTGIDIRFDNVIVFIDFSNCLPLIDTAIIGKVN